MKLLPSLLFAFVLAAGAAAQETGSVTNAPELAPRKIGVPQPLFNGKDLEGWAGNKELWSVKNGVIHGSTVDKPIPHNTFLVWTGGTVDNFEFTCKYRLIPGDDKGFANSGIQYRSLVNQPGEAGPIISGYQADSEAGTTHTGGLYEEKGRGILCKRGQKVVITADPANAKKPKIEVTGSCGDADAIQATIKNGEWVEYKVVAKGNHLQHWINGMQTVDVIDNDPKGAKEGALALQIHHGPPMTVEYKDIVLTELK